MFDYKGVVFDFNGTLFFDEDKHILAWGAIAKELRGYPVSEEEIQIKINGKPNVHTIQYLMDGKATEDDLVKYSLLKEEYYRDYCRKDKEGLHLVAGTVEFFDSLKARGIPFTIASASIKPNIDFFIKSFNLDNWIDPANIVYDDGTYDNKINMYKDAANKLNVDIKDILVLEDSPSGIKNAYAAGVENIIVICSKDKEEQLGSLPGVIKTMPTLEGIEE